VFISSISFQLIYTHSSPSFPLLTSRLLPIYPSSQRVQILHRRFEALDTRSLHRFIFANSFRRRTTTKQSRASTRSVKPLSSRSTSITLLLLLILDFLTPNKRRNSAELFLRPTPLDRIRRPNPHTLQRNHTRIRLLIHPYTRTTADFQTKGIRNTAFCRTRAAPVSRGDERRR